jgi:hypothetical protein
MIWRRDMKRYYWELAHGCYLICDRALGLSRRVIAYTDYKHDAEHIVDGMNQRAEEKAEAKADA